MTALAYAAGESTAAAGPGVSLGDLIPFILIFIIFYFLLIRPQQQKAREHQTFLNNMKKGDEVVTSGGIHGKITGMTNTVLTLEIAPNVRIKVNRSSIMTSAADAKKQAESPAAKLSKD